MKLQVRKFQIKKFYNENFKILKIKRSLSFVEKRRRRGFEIEIVLTKRKNRQLEGSLIITKF